VTPALIALAAAVAAGGVVAVSAREPRFAALGLLVVLVGTAYVADPLPDTIAVAARLTGAVLAGYLVWVALRRPGAPTSGWQIGWPGATAIAAVAFIAGWMAASALGTELAAGSGEGPGAGAATALAAGGLVPRAAIAAAAAMLALASTSVLVARDALRLGLGLLLLVAAAELLRHAFAAGPDPVVELAMAILVAISGASVAALVSATLRAHGDLQLRPGAGRATAIRHRTADEAHPRRARPDSAS
jgi:hypothetical protein